MELTDNKSENYILQKVFGNENIIQKITEIFSLLEKRESIELGENMLFFTKWYKRIGFISESYLGDAEKQDIIFLLFGKNITGIETLTKQLEHYCSDINVFRDTPVEEKGFILYLFELITEKKLNIDDVNFQILMGSQTDKNTLYEMVVELCMEGLEIILKDLEELFKQYQNFFDTYFSFESNYMNEDELDSFQNAFLEMFQYLYSYLMLQEDVQNKQNEIEKRISAGIILN